jgi:hypothetical protein
MTLEEKSYIYGLLLSDGTLYLAHENTLSGTMKLEISERDEDIVDKLCSIVPNSTKTRRVRDTNFKTGYHSVSFNVSRQEFIKEMVDFGFVTEKKSQNARPPIKEYDKNAFWRGVIDGNGSIGLRKNSSGNTDAFLSLIINGDDLKNEFCSYLQSITGHQYSPKRNKRDNVYNVGCGGHAACRVLKMLYKDATIYLNRKYQKYLECMDWELENNKPKRNTSGVIGVGINRGLNKWMAYITINKNNIDLGVYDDKNDAIMARLKFEKEHFGDYALQKHLFAEYGLE